LYTSGFWVENKRMQKLYFVAFLFSLSACVSSPGLKNGLVDSSSLPSFSEAQELRLGDIRYGKQRLEERESIAWSFLRDGAFQRGVPRDEESQLAMKVKVYEVGQAERGKYRGFALERWDVSEERAGGKTRHYHHYFFRSPNRLVHLPRMTKGADAGPLWEKGKRGQEVLNYLNSRWSVSLGEDTAYEVPELALHRHISVPGEGTFRAVSSGESLSEVEARNGAATVLSVLPKGKEVYRVPGNWLICVLPDGLAIPLQKE
jgi:hypothetical protein